MTIEPGEFAARFPRIAEHAKGDDLAALLAHLGMRELAAGEVLLAAGSHSDAVYFVWDGQLKVSLGPDAPAGGFGPGAILGEVSLLDADLVSATVTADAAASVLSLDRARLAALRTGHPRAATALLRAFSITLAERVRVSSERLDQLRGAPPQTRRRGLWSTLRHLLTSEPIDS